MEYVAPKFLLTAFHCPLCGVYSHMKWNWLADNSMYKRKPYREAKCSHCEQASLWKPTVIEKTVTMSEVLEGTPQNQNAINDAIDGVMLYPDFGDAPIPEQDMPKDVKRDYMEAATIFSRSPRGAAALLRLGLQKLCKHLGEEGKNIYKDIRELAAKNTLPPLVVKVADTVRITGNNAVHPGEMLEEDFDHVASKMFVLLNFIVKKGITEPKELEALYSMTPEGPRKSAEEEDAKAKEQNEL